MKVVRLFVLALLASPMCHVTWASDDLYRCADGTFTNRVERQCQPYESTGIVRVQGRTREAVKSPIRGDEEKQRLAEVKRLPEPTKLQEGVPHR
jgi:hypothetical protein